MELIAKSEGREEGKILGQIDIKKKCWFGKKNWLNRFEKKASYLVNWIAKKNQVNANDCDRPV